MPFLFSAIVLVLVCGALYWLISIAPFIDDKFKQIAQWLLIAICVIYALSMLFGAAPPLFHNGFRY